MQGLILAGGEGTRMGRLTADLPKPLLYLPGGTLLEHQLTLLSRFGVSQTFVVTRHRERDIVRALRGLGDVTPLSQRPPSTLLGALATAKGHVRGAVMVLHGDNYFSRSLEYAVQAGRSMVEAGRSKAVFVVEDEDEQGGEAERLASTGCYVLSPDLLDLVSKLSAGDELRSLTGALLGSGVPVESVPLRGWRANVNTLNDLLTVSHRMLERWSDSFHPAHAGEGYNRCQRRAEVESPVWVSPGAETMGSRLGPFVAIGPRAVVEDCVLRETIVFPGAEIRGLKAEGVIVLRGPAGPLVLASQDESGRREQGHGEKEPS
jgi:NDP-sugar pyrophosphorylase family protein